MSTCTCPTCQSTTPGLPCFGCGHVHGSPEIVKHTHPVVFGRRVDGCPRCAELGAGAPVRTSPKWEAVNRRKAQDAQQAAAYARHRAEAARLGYCPTCQTPATRTAVCTCFDW